MADEIYCAFERLSFPAAQFAVDPRHGTIHVSAVSGGRSVPPPHSICGYDLGPFGFSVSPSITSETSEQR
jgi:hypothetical protein